MHEVDSRRFSSAITNYLSVAYLVGMIGVVYHLVGFQAMEREKGLSTLIEAMGGSKFARMISYHFAFSFVYIIGWVVMSLNIWGGVVNRSSPVIVILWHISKLITPVVVVIVPANIHLAAGWAMASWAMLLGSIFKKAQLSGISATVFSLGLGVIAQVSKDAGTGAYAILSFLFPPMNYVFFFISIGRWEGKEMGASLLKKAPAGNSTLPLLAFWIFSLVHIAVFPIAAAYVERYLFGTASTGHRHINSATITPGNAVEVQGFTKRYPPRLLTRLFGKRKETVVAVDNLHLNVLEGQIMVLLGANGSGKTTTLEAIAGLASVKEGDINISTGAGGGVGICPQKNVLWDDLTVEEHVRIWNLIKSRGDDKETLKRLIEECDLTMKRHAKSKTLSGGQKRKLQLAAMFTGGSTICAIDEVSSGLDPLSRRKIWDIILAARGTRTILMTSHFLDEADLLADHIAILSKGHLKCEGSAVQLKTQYGGGYRVHAPISAPSFQGVSMKRFYDKTIYNIPDANQANQLIESLEKSGVSDYYVAGPSIEDVFLK
jgi:ABC-type multidrug transport system ATPase subunit